MKNIHVIWIVCLLACSCANDVGPVGAEEPVVAESGKGLAVVYEHGATHAEWGRTRFTIHEDGAAEIVESGRRVSGGAVTNVFTLSSNEVKQVADAIRDNRFFSLREQYQKRGVNDGWSAFIRVQMDGREHSVTVMNTRVDKFNAVTKVLDELARAHTPQSVEELPEAAAAGE